MEHKAPISEAALGVGRGQPTHSLLSGRCLFRPARDYDREAELHGRETTLEIALEIASDERDEIRQHLADRQSARAETCMPQS